MSFFSFAILFVVSFFGVDAYRWSWFRRGWDIYITVEITCLSKPNATYTIELWERDNGSDDYLAKNGTQLSNGHGVISMKGEAIDISCEGCVEPYLIVRSDCKDELVAYNDKKYSTHIDAFPKYCIQLSECPECVVWGNQPYGKEQNDACDKAYCEDETDHCIMSDWKRTLRIPHNSGETYYRRFLCDHLPNND